MKKALLLGLMGWLLAAAPVLAHPPMPANVNFTSERGVPFGLVLDGQPLTRGLARQVHVDQLLPGQHWADFTLPTAYGGAVRFRSRVWLQPGLETTFVLLTRPGRPLFLQQVNAVALYAPGYGGGNGYYNSPAPYGQSGSYGANDSYNNDNTDDDDGDDDGYNSTPAPNAGPGYGTNPNYPNGGYLNTPNSNSSGGYPSTPNGGYNNAPNYPNGGPGRNPNSPAGSYPNNSNGGYNNAPAPSRYRNLNSQDTDALVRTVQARIAEASKLSAAKEGLAQRSLRADELTRLLRTISSETCQIDLATFAYSHVSDPENFNRVYAAFATESGPRAVEAALNKAAQR